MRHIGFVINPISGSGNKTGLEAHIEAVFPAGGDVQTSLYYTKCKGDAEPATERFVMAGCDVIVAVGGDGTVNQVGQVVLKARMGWPPFDRKYDITLGIIPLGSGNGLGRHLHIATDPVKALRVIGRGKQDLVDVGFVNDAFFFCTAGVGFDATVGYRFNTAPRRGFMTYMGLTVDTYAHYIRRHYKLRLDDKEVETDAFLITLANASQWGYNFFVAPDASVQDGMLDVVVWRRAPLATVPFMAMELLTKTIGDDLFVDTYRCRRVSLEREESDYVHFDGEATVMGPTIEAGIYHKLLQVLIP